MFASSALSYFSTQAHVLAATLMALQDAQTDVVVEYTRNQGLLLGRHQSVRSQYISNMIWDNGCHGTHDCVNVKAIERASHSLNFEAAFLVSLDTRKTGSGELKCFS